MKIQDFLVLGMLFIGVIYLYCAIKMLRQSYKELEYRRDLLDRIENASSKDEWFKLRDEVNEDIKKRYRKSFIEQKSHGPLHIALSNKAKSLFK